jgi:hypothetical protein
MALLPGTNYPVGVLRCGNLVSVPGK